MQQQSGPTSQSIRRPHEVSLKQLADAVEARREKIHDHAVLLGVGGIPVVAALLGGLSTPEAKHQWILGVAWICWGSAALWAFASKILWMYAYSNEHNRIVGIRNEDGANAADQYVTSRRQFHPGKLAYISLWLLFVSLAIGFLALLVFGAFLAF